VSVSEREKSYEWQVEDARAGQRVDKFVTAQGEWSRSLVQSWIAEKRVTVNARAVKANYRLQRGDRVALRVPPPEHLAVTPEEIPLDIVYEDADIVVVNKPRGMVVHPAPGHHTGTLVHALLAHCGNLSTINGVYRPGIVHRIDKDTSGLLVAAKNDSAHASLASQLSAHTVERSYTAIVHGDMGHERGTVDAPIGRNPNQRQEMAVVRKNGKRAVTHFVVREKFKGYTLVDCRLETGRTHQIRVHMAFIGHPLVGDPKYGPKKNRFSIQGQALHARTLGFTHPRTGEEMTFEAPLPQDMVDILNRLRRESGL
jgi:23S rRNA pseudouridine1911/1915/1917 synthase